MTAEEPLVIADSLIADFGEDLAYRRAIGMAVMAVRMGDHLFEAQLGLALQELVKRGLHKKRVQP